MKKQCYVLVYPNGSLAGIDYSSGYPYEAYGHSDNSGDVSGVRFFREESLKRAHDFMKHFPELTLKEFHWKLGKQMSNENVLLDEEWKDEETLVSAKYNKKNFSGLKIIGLIVVVYYITSMFLK